MTTTNSQHDINVNCMNKLIQHACQGTTVTYPQLIQMCIIDAQGNLGAMRLQAALHAVHNWSRSKGLPLITCLALRESGEDIGLPTKRFWESLDSGPNPIDYKEFYSEGPISEAPQSVRRAYAAYLQQTCFTYFSDLRPKGNTAQMPATLGSAQSAWFGVTPDVSNIHEFLHSLFDIQGFTDLSNSHQLKIINKLVDEDGTINLQLRYELLEILNRNAVYNSGDFKRGWETIAAEFLNL